MKGKIHYSSVVHTVINVPFAKELVSLTRTAEKRHKPRYRMSYGRVVNCATVLLAKRDKCYKDREWCKLGQDKLQAKERKVKAEIGLGKENESRKL